MRAILMLFILALAGCENETAAERTAAAHKVCSDAGLVAKEGASLLGTMVVYCSSKEKP